MIQISNLEEITEQDIPKLVQKATKQLNSREVLYKRIHRKSDVADLVFSVNGEKKAVTFEKYIWLTSSGFLGGKAPVYTVTDTVDENKKNLIKELLGKEVGQENYKESMEILIDYIKKYNDDATEHYELMQSVLGMRGAYEIIYEDENNNIIYTNLDPLQTVAIYDYSAPVNLIGLLRIYPETDINDVTKEVVEVWTKSGKKVYREQEKEQKNKEKTYRQDEGASEAWLWKDVPASAVEIDESIFESEVDLIKKYEKLIQNTSNMFQYNDEAKLAISGYNPENPLTITVIDEETGKPKVIKNLAREIEDKAILEAKTLYFPNGEGKAEWILKDINDSAIQNTLKTYIDLIMMNAGVPNTYDLGFTNADNASALDRKFFNLIIMTLLLVAQFKKMYQRRWELIFDRINQLKGTNFDFRDIEIEIPQYLPANESELTDMWLKLRNLISDETIVEKLPFGLDYTSEKNKMDEEQQQSIEKMVNMQNAMGNNQNNINNEADNQTNVDNVDNSVESSKNEKEENINE